VIPDARFTRIYSEHCQGRHHSTPESLGEQFSQVNTFTDRRTPMEFNYKDIEREHGTLRANIELEIALLEDIVSGFWSLHELAIKEDNGLAVLLSALVTNKMYHLDRLKELSAKISMGVTIDENTDTH
jgi:hypothetical protein